MYETHRDGDRLAITPTSAGRGTAATIRFLLWTPVAMLGFTILFMPDYLCQYREQQPVSVAFWVVIGAAALFIGAVGAFVRFSRRDRWTFEAGADEIVVEADPLVGRSARASAAFGEWTGLRAVRSPLFGRSRIEAVFRGDRPDEIVCESRLGWATIADVWKELATFVEDAELDVDLDETSAEPTS